MTVMSSSLTSAPSIVRPSSIVRQITSATGQAEQVDFMVSLGCENGSLNSSIFYPRLTYFPTSPRRENTPPRTLKTEEPVRGANSVDENPRTSGPHHGLRARLFFQAQVQRSLFGVELFTPDLHQQRQFRFSVRRTEMFENFTLPTSFGHDLNGRGARTGWDFTQKRAHNSSLRIPLVPQNQHTKAADQQ